MEIKIYRLCERPEFAVLCHAWDEAEWPRTPEIEEFFSNHYEEASRNQGAGLPQTFIAVANDDQLIGMLSLIADDHPDFLHLKPWIASVYIPSDKRNGQAVYQLQKAAINFARDKMSNNYLYTYTHMNLKRKGWEYLQEIGDPFDSTRKVGLYRYDVTQSMDSTKRK